MAKFERTINEIEQNIKDGTAAVCTIWEMKEIIKTEGLEMAFEKIDVITAGTFEPVEVAKVSFQFPQIYPKIEIEKLFLNEVEVTLTDQDNCGILEAAASSSGDDKRYGGAQVIEELLSNGSVSLKVQGIVADTHSSGELESILQLNDLTKAELEIHLVNEFTPRAAINSSDRDISSYLGMLIQNYGNINYSGGGENSPFLNPLFISKVKAGTKVFIGGAIGNVSANNQGGKKELTIQGNLKQMKEKYVRAGGFGKSGCFLYLGIGFVISVLDIDILKNFSITNDQIDFPVMDLGKDAGGEKLFRHYSFKELEVGTVSVDVTPVKTNSLYSLSKSMTLSEELKEQVIKGEFSLK